MASPDGNIQILLERRASVQKNANATAAYELGASLILWALTFAVNPFFSIPAAAMSARVGRNLAKASWMNNPQDAERYFHEERAIAAEPLLRRVVRLALGRPTFSQRTYGINWADPN